MFFQICLLTAGLHAARTLYKRWQESAAEQTYPVSSKATTAEASTDGQADAKGADSGQTALSLYEVSHPEAAAIQEQFEIALVSTGISLSSTAFCPRLQFLGGIGVMFGSIPIFQTAKRLLFEEGRIGIETLDSVSLLVSIAARQYGISALMFLLYSVTQKLRLRTERASRRSLLEAFDRRPNHAWVLKDGVEVQVPCDALCPGDIVVVTAGSSVPADGIVQEGMALLDQHLLTGESHPAEKMVGDAVFGQTVVVSGRILVHVKTAGKKTAAAEISQILQRTADFASSVEHDSKKLADASALPILTLGMLSHRVVGVEGTLALLNVDMADNLRLIAPFSLLNYLRKAYEQGMLLKDGRSLQLLSQVDTVVFDKTGTLTQGHFQVRQIHAIGGVTEEEVLRYAATAEYRQSHPIARAIANAAAERGHEVRPIDDAHYEIGYGLSVKLDGRTARVGSKRFMEAHAIAIPDSLQNLEGVIYASGHSLVYVAWDDTLVGVIELEPLLRPESAAVLQALRARNLTLYLLSGDHEEPTSAMARRLAFDRHIAGVLPQDKARIIQALQEEGRRVCFVGDGINDAIALKQSTVSVSMSGASTVAMDSAQIVLMESGLQKLPSLFSIADDFQRNMRGILLSAVVPAGVAVVGIFLAGFKTSAVASLYAASLAAGMAIATWPQTSTKSDEHVGPSTPYRRHHVDWLDS